MSEDNLSLLPAARRAKTVGSRVGIASRARKRADLWERFLSDWPGNALAEFARRDADAIDALFYDKGLKS